MKKPTLTLSDRIDALERAVADLTQKAAHQTIADFEAADRSIAVQRDAAAAEHDHA